MSTCSKRFFLKAQNTCFTNKPLKIHRFLPAKNYKIFTTFKMDLDAKQFFLFSGDKLQKTLPAAPVLGGTVVQSSLCMFSIAF